MRYDWPSLLAEAGVPWITGGRRVRAGRLAVRCPFCDDPSEHMTIDPDGGLWSCWRCKTSGRRPHYLLLHLTGISGDALDAMVERSAASADIARPDDLRSRLAALDAPREAPAPDTADHPSPRSLVPLPPSGPVAAYVRRRGYRPEWCSAQGLRACYAEPWAGRVLFPLGLPDDPPDAPPAGWVGREATGDRRASRYLSTHSASGLLYLPPAATSGGRLLVIIEGPFDALRARQGAELAKLAGVGTVAVLGAARPGSRLPALLTLRRRYAEAWSVPDPKAASLMEELAGALDSRLVLPPGPDDLGAASPRETAEWLARKIS